MTLQAAAPESPKGTIGACVFTAFFAPFYFLAVVALYLFLFAIALPGGDGAATEASVAAFREEHRTLLRALVWLLFGVAAWAGLAAVRRIFKRANQKRVIVFFGIYYILLLLLAVSYLGAVGTLLLQGAAAVAVVCVLMYRMPGFGTGQPIISDADRAFLGPRPALSSGTYIDLEEPQKPKSRTFVRQLKRGQRIAVFVVMVMVFLMVIPATLASFINQNYIKGLLWISGGVLFYLSMRWFMSKTRLERMTLTIDSANGITLNRKTIPWSEIGRVWRHDESFKGLMAIELSESGAQMFCTDRSWLWRLANRGARKGRFFPGGKGQIVLNTNFYDADVGEIVATLHRLRPGPTRVDPETRGMAETV